ncbi:pilus assembly protein [Kribbella albertanoniae]|uniref:Pilus assembly protein n=1 Tax=Kribbella albertanoniae TaxID=1266829 RepID=A0A4R4Q6A5_9ACTN|nr:TadE family protein [Kribbella albertanoniae]TDC30529.1 pilus assembly protein [Kribbella albertanoniae]
MNPSERERGSMAVEMVILAPVMMAFVLLVVACGRYVAVRGDIEAASRDAVRAASLERSAGKGTAAADRVAAVAVEHPERCAPAELTGDFVAGGTITITITCDVSYAGLGLLGLPGSKRVSVSSSAPMDTHKEFDAQP